jgi:hypothetical protein
MNASYIRQPNAPAQARKLANDLEVSAVIVRAPGYGLAVWKRVHPDRQSDAQKLCETALDLVERYAESGQWRHSPYGQYLMRFPTHRVTVLSERGFMIAVSHRVDPNRTLSKSISRTLRAIHRAWPDPK